MKNRYGTRLLILLALCLFGATEVALAQGTNLGTIRGTVTDANGAVVAGAKVQVTDLATDLSRAITTDSDGNYEITGLRSGSYKVNVTASGFRSTTINTVALRGGGTVRTDASLQVGAATESVEVTGTTQINLETPTIAAQLTARDIQELPHDSRDIYSFLYLNPNITQGNGENTYKFIGAQGYGASLSLDGQRSNGRFFDSFNKENIDNRRTVRITLRLTF
jgi:hypothetical protein